MVSAYIEWDKEATLKYKSIGSATQALVSTGVPYVYKVWLNSSGNMQDNIYLRISSYELTQPSPPQCLLTCQ